jgi:hypothetical protein
MQTWFSFVPPVFTNRENNNNMASTGFQRALQQCRHVSVSVTDGQVVAIYGSIFFPGVSVWVLSKSVQKPLVRLRGSGCMQVFVMEACRGARHVIAFQNVFLDRVHMFLLTGASLGGYKVTAGETLQVTGNCLVKHGTLALTIYALHSGEHMAALFVVRRCSFRVGLCAWRQQGSKFYVRATLLSTRVVVEVDMARSPCPTRMYVQQLKACRSGGVEILPRLYVTDLGFGVLDRCIWAGTYGMVWHADKDGGTCRQAFCMSHARKSWMQACGL